MIEVLETAPLNSVQDLGRIGFRKYGINRSGALDRIALAAANVMLGNDENAAVIEIQLFPMRLRFERNTSVAITGAACGTTVDGVDLPPWWATTVKAGQTLLLSQPSSGLRSYIAVAGGIDVPKIMGSAATYSRLGIGGHLGRTLQAGDKLQCFSAQDTHFRDDKGFGAIPPAVALAELQHPTAEKGDVVVRVVAAAEYDEFDTVSKHRLWEGGWKVTTQSSRMGYCLSGEPLQRIASTEMRSHGIVPGVIQVPPSGQPIIQLYDGNIAGGYPKIGCVIEADLWRIAQARPGSVVRFVQTSISESRKVAVEVATFIENLRRQARYCFV